jgi:hypothetical protein
MSNVNITVQINIKPTDESATSVIKSTDNGSFSIVLHDARFNIDALEQGLLNVAYPALREAMSQALEAAAKAQAVQEKQEYNIIRRETDYQVDGEVGRFSFGLYDVYNSDGQMIFSGNSWLPDQHGKQKYLTEGFKEIAIFSGVSQRSYRKTTAGINRARHHNSDGTPLNTLRDQSEREGAKVLAAMERQTTSLFTSHFVDQNNQPLEGSKLLQDLEEFTPKKQPKEQVSKALERVTKSMSRRDFDDDLIEKVKSTKVGNTYESSSDTTNISIDDVGAKKQKENRKKGVISERQKNTRPTVQNTVAQIEKPGQGYTLTGSSVAQVLRFILAFLLNNGLVNNRLCLFADGQRSLQDSVLSFFAWHPYTMMILDWYHVVKKFKEGLSLACCGRSFRNKHLWIILRLIWYGLVAEAVEYLRKIPASDLKNPEAINTLIGYLKRNKKYLPCYALRKELGLKNSSNSVERMNNIVTASRQKHNGMSWSKSGSHALTALTAVVCNKATKRWLQKGVVSLVFPVTQKKAA